MEQWKFIVKGRVQGVFFRASTVEHVRLEKIAVTGTVRNILDGTVEVVARGEIEQLERVHLYLQKGPRMSRVDGVRIMKEELGECFESFKQIN